MQKFLLNWKNKIDGTDTCVRTSGPGIAPFIAILRDLKLKNELVGNRLIFANKTKEDFILQKEFEGLLGKDFVNILSKEKADGFKHGLITKEFLEANVSGHTGMFYVCGPPPMMDTVPDQLAGLGISDSSIIKEGL